MAEANRAQQWRCSWPSRDFWRAFTFCATFCSSTRDSREHNLSTTIMKQSTPLTDQILALNFESSAIWQYRHHRVCNDGHLMKWSLILTDACVFVGTFSVLVWLVGLWVKPTHLSSPCISFVWFHASHLLILSRLREPHPCWISFQWWVHTCQPGSRGLRCLGTSSF